MYPGGKFSQQQNTNETTRNKNRAKKQASKTRDSTDMRVKELKSERQFAHMCKRANCCKLCNMAVIMIDSQSEVSSAEKQVSV